MFAQTLGYVVSIGITRVRVDWSIWNIARILGKASEKRASVKPDSGQLPATEAILEKTQVVAIRPLPSSHVLKRDVVRGIASPKFVEQGWLVAAGRLRDSR